MQYKITETGVTFPENEIRVHFPNVSLPPILAQADLDHLGLIEIPDLIPPVYEPTPEELAEQAQLEAEQFQQFIVNTVQSRLDTFAKTRSYDGILSACTYANSVIPRFQSDGQYCVAMRDTYWETLYGYMLEVQSGNHPIPSSVEEVLALLPALKWPN